MLAGKSISFVLQFESQPSAIALEFGGDVSAIARCFHATPIWCGLGFVASLAQERQRLSEISSRQSGVCVAVNFDSSIFGELFLPFFEQFIE
jgi:hypothetical protein